LGGATLTDTTFRLILNCVRGGNTANILTTTFDFPNTTPGNPTHLLSGVYKLAVGDQLFFQSIQYLSAGSFTINGASAPPLDFDLNTFWDWILINPTP
jgi:hypothetical protein